MKEILFVISMIAITTIASCSNSELGDKIKNLKDEDLYGVWIIGDSEGRNGSSYADSYLILLENKTFVAGGLIGVTCEVSDDSITIQSGKTFRYPRNITYGITGNWSVKGEGINKSILLYYNNLPAPKELIVCESVFSDDKHPWWQGCSRLELSSYGIEDIREQYFIKTDKLPNEISLQK